MQIPVGYKIVDGIMVPMTTQEKIDAGILTEAEAALVEIYDEINLLQEYLAHTDWYAIRFAETAEAVPADVLTARQSARDRISELRDE